MKSAHDWIRTSMSLRTPPPQDGMSTNFTTWAFVKRTFLSDFCDPAGIRTQDPYIKSVLLYQLSYEIKSFFKASANI
jgi:hypothetical protein